MNYSAFELSRPLNSLLGARSQESGVVGAIRESPVQESGGRDVACNVRTELVSLWFLIMKTAVIALAVAIPLLCRTTNHTYDDMSIVNGRTLSNLYIRGGFF